MKLEDLTEEQLKKICYAAGEYTFDSVDGTVLGMNGPGDDFYVLDVSPDGMVMFERGDYGDAGYFRPGPVVDLLRKYGVDGF